MQQQPTFHSVVKSETALWIGTIITVLFLLYGNQWVTNLANPVTDTLLFIGLFCIMLVLAFNVVKHADSLAVLLGEPYGTLILTLSVICIEVVMISALMLIGDNNPTLARDTMFSVLMIVLNGLLGITLLIGGLKYHEQEYNLEGSKAYLGVLAPLAILGLVLPSFTNSTPGGEVSVKMGIFLLLMSVSLYLVFLIMQTMRHSHHFVAKTVNEDKHEEHANLTTYGITYHAFFLVLNILPIVILAKYMAKILDYVIATFGAPQPLGGFLVAILVLCPEAITAAKAALANQLQRTVNIALGSALSTIGLTIPAVLAISMLSGRTIELGLAPEGITLLLLTLLVSTINLGTVRTNVLQGAVHLIIFFSYVMIIFE